MFLRFLEVNKIDSMRSAQKAETEGHLSTVIIPSYPSENYRITNFTLHRNDPLIPLSKIILCVLPVSLLLFLALIWYYLQKVSHVYMAEVIARRRRFAILNFLVP